MHILGILMTLTAFAIAMEVIRQTVWVNRERILEALAGVAREPIDLHTEEMGRVVPFRPVVARPAFRVQPDSIAA